MIPLRAPDAKRLANHPADEPTRYVEVGGTTHRPTLTTRWRPTIEELAILIGGGDIVVTLAGGGHPPIDVAAVEPLPDETLPAQPRRAARLPAPVPALPA